MPRRIEQVNSLIQEELNQIFLKDFIFEKGTLVTITGVDTAGNIQIADVQISVFPEKETEKIMNLLGKNIYDIQQKLNKRLKMRPVPKIIFSLETRTQTAARVEELLAKIKEK